MSRSFLFIILVYFIALSLLVSATNKLRCVKSQEPPAPKKYSCRIEERSGPCNTTPKPVCGYFSGAGCFPPCLYKNFRNPCMACHDLTVEFYIVGQCKEDLN